MKAVELDDQRCKKCHKLLFRGVLGMGIVEVKCPRCGHISSLHSVDTLLRGKKEAYILVYNPQGKIIVASKSAYQLLGYSKDELDELRIQDISPRNQLPILDDVTTDDALQEWERYHIGLTRDIIHRKKEGTMLEVSARFYPIPSYNGFYTVAVYHKKSD